MLRHQPSAQPASCVQAWRTRVASACQLSPTTSQFTTGLCCSALADVGPVVVGPVINEPVASESEIYAQPIVRTMPMMIPRKTRLVCFPAESPPCLGRGHNVGACQRFPRPRSDLRRHVGTVCNGWRTRRRVQPSRPRLADSSQQRDCDLHSWRFPAPLGRAQSAGRRRRQGPMPSRRSRP